MPPQMKIIDPASAAAHARRLFEAAGYMTIKRSEGSYSVFTGAIIPEATSYMGTVIEGSLVIHFYGKVP